MIAVFNPNEAQNSDDDERDKLIWSQAAGVSSIFLFVGIVLLLGKILILGVIGEELEIAMVSLFEVANVLLFILVLSDVVHHGLQLYYYRRGI